MTEVRKTIRYDLEDAAMIDGLALGLGVPVSEFVRGCSLKFAAQHAKDLRDSGQTGKRRTKSKAPVPKVDVAEYLSETTNTPIEMIRRRISLGLVHLGGQPHFIKEIPANQAENLEPQWD